MIRICTGRYSKYSNDVCAGCILNTMSYAPGKILNTMSYAPGNILNIIRPYTGEYAKDHRDLCTGKYFNYCMNVCRTTRKYRVTIKEIDTFNVM